MGEAGLSYQWVQCCLWVGPVIAGQEFRVISEGVNYTKKLRQTIGQYQVFHSESWTQLSRWLNVYFRCMVATNFSGKSLQSLWGAQGELGLDKESLLQNLWQMSIIWFVRSTVIPELLFWWGLCWAGCCINTNKSSACDPSTLQPNRQKLLNPGTSSPALIPLTDGPAGDVTQMLA